MEAVKASSRGWMECISLNRRRPCSGVTLYRNTCLTWCSRAADCSAAPSSNCACGPAVRRQAQARARGDGNISTGLCRETQHHVIRVAGSNTWLSPHAGR